MWKGFHETHSTESRICICFLKVQTGKYTLLTCDNDNSDCDAEDGDSDVGLVVCLQYNNSTGNWVLTFVSIIFLWAFRVLNMSSFQSKESPKL